MRNIMKKVVLLLLATVPFFSSVKADYPIVSHRYLADPGSLVYNGRVYLYCSNDDENPVEGGYKMASFVCISSSDMKNWTDHGVVFSVPQDASWAEKSWAPSVVERNGKFYLYFGNGGSSIGVAVADSPTGPFKDPLNGKLVSSETPGVMPAEHMWLFDPMTYVDDDGQAYMYFGGNGEDNVRVIKLNEDMISVDGAASRFTVPYFFEASWMHKHNGKYYFSYSTNPRNGMRIDYMVSDNPMSGFTYGGVMSPQPPENDNNNHQAVFEFDGKTYQAYHNRIVAREAGIPPTYKRNLCIDQIFYNEDGSIQEMKNTVDGVAQVQNVNPFEKVEAETTNAQSGIETKKCEKGMCITDISTGDWIKVKGVDFGKKGAKSFNAVVANVTSNSEIEIRLDDKAGESIGSLSLSDTNAEQSVKIQKTKGIHDVYFVFKGKTDGSLFDFDSWYFE